MKQIYIIEDGSNNKKVGITSNIHRRMMELNTAISTGIRDVIVSDFMLNAHVSEKQLHKANEEHQLKGEWFSKITDFCAIEFFPLKINAPEKETAMFKENFQIISNCYAGNYIVNLGNLFKLPVGTTGVLICLVTMADYKGIIALNKYLRDSIAERMNAKLAKNGKPSISVVNKAITELLNKEIISRIGSSTYQLNPNLFARGKWRDIYEQRKAFKVTITYSHDENGGKREIITEQRDADVLQFPTAEGENL